MAWDIRFKKWIEYYELVQRNTRSRRLKTLMNYRIASTRMSMHEAEAARYAKRIKAPKGRVRQATTRDVVPGAVLWHKDSYRWVGGSYVESGPPRWKGWLIVLEVDGLRFTDLEGNGHAVDNQWWIEVIK